jgi:hypothetical protein
MQKIIILPLLVDSLRSYGPAAGAEICSLLERSTARQIWQYLLREQADKQLFYREESNSS